MLFYVFKIIFINFGTLRTEIYFVFEDYFTIIYLVEKLNHTCRVLLKWFCLKSISFTYRSVFSFFFFADAIVWLAYVFKNSVLFVKILRFLESNCTTDFQ